MKHLFLVVATATISTIASAQVQFGLKAGLNLATTLNSPKNPTTSYSIKLDFHAGALASIPLSEDFSLQPEILYSAEGGKSKFKDLNGVSGTAKLNLGYINVPILLKYNFPSGLFVELGPQPGILISAKGKGTFNGTSSGGDVKDQVKTFNFSGVIGVGYLSSMNIGIDMRFNYGFLNFGKNKGSDNSRSKTQTIQIGIYYLFGERKQRD